MLTHILLNLCINLVNKDEYITYAQCEATFTLQSAALENKFGTVRKRTAAIKADRQLMRDRLNAP